MKEGGRMGFLEFGEWVSSNCGGVHTFFIQHSSKQSNGQERESLLFF